jgi:RNA polymerase sigma-70 factor (ECF subfamily)
MSELINNIDDNKVYEILRTDPRLKEKAFEALYSRFSKRIFVFLKKMLGSDPVVEDIFQETFIRVLRCAEKDVRLDNVNAFIYKIAGNLALNQIAKNKRVRNVFVSSIDIEKSSGQSHSDSFESDEIASMVEKALELLPDEMKEAFCMQNYLGLKYEEIGEITGKPVSTVRNRVVRAKSKLREILAPFYGEKFNYKVSDE